MNIKTLNAQLPKIVCYDPLADFLGSFDGGVVEYDFEYIAKLTGHACPTVLTAYLSAVAVKERLYGEDKLVRGGVKIYMRDAKDSGTTGVVASVYTAIFGASDEGGFKGIGNMFKRANNINFGAKIDGFASFCRVDRGDSVIIDFDFMPVQKMATPDIFEALESFKNGSEIAYFQNAWSEKLHKIADIFETQNVIKIKSTNKM
ncbi:MAG: hypothetical protein JHC37_06440 [Campylobacteraceae bacterium]|jgi:hypothetical protein|nr:hypothetical protein [Campylobacteraceae bacterium]